MFSCWYIGCWVSDVRLSYDWPCIMATSRLKPCIFVIHKNKFIDNLKTWCKRRVSLSIKLTCKLNWFFLEKFFSGWFAYEKEFEKASKDGRLKTAHTLYYEDLKMVGAFLALTF